MKENAVCMLVAGVVLAIAVDSHARMLVRVPLDVPTIAEALVVAGENGVIHVAEGQHAGGFTITQGVTIQGGFPPDFVGDPDPWQHPTTVYGIGGSALTAELGTGDSVFVDGLIFTQASNGIQANLTGDAQLTLSTVTCTANARGLDVSVIDTAVLNGNLVFLLDNEAADMGAGLRAVADGEGAITISGGEITGNTAESGGAGAVIEASGAAVVSLLDMTISGNGYPAPPGGADPGTMVFSIAGEAAIFIDGSEVSCNRPAQPGDAAIGGTLIDSGLVQITETTFLEGDGAGEAIEARSNDLAALRLIGSTFEDAAALTGPIVDLTSEGQSVIFLLRNQFRNNTSAAPLVRSEQLGSSFVNADGNILRGNTTPGEVISMNVSESASGALLRAINNQISANNATGGSGGALFTVAGPNLAQVGFNTVVENTAPSGAAGIRLSASDMSPAEVSNNIAVGNTAAGVPADLSVQGFLAKAFGNFLTGDGDPGFQGEYPGDFHLAPDSELVNAADPEGFTIDNDFEEDPRPVAGARDVGSDEYRRTGDINLDGFVDVQDLLMLLSAWGTCPDCLEDLNGDDVVDVQDLLLLLANWGP